MAAWFRRQDPDEVFDIQPYQEVPDPPMTAELAQACAGAFHVLCMDGRVLAAGRASLYVFGRLGYPKTTAFLALPPFIWLVELGYRIVANNRIFWDRVLFGRDRR